MRGAGCGGRVRCSTRGRIDRGATLNRARRFFHSPVLTAHFTRTAQVGGPGALSSRQAAAGKADFSKNPPRHKSAISAGNKGSPAGGCPKQAVPTIARGTPDVFGVFVVTTLVCFLNFAREAADALCIRRSVRPHYDGANEEHLKRAGARGVQTFQARPRFK